MFETLTHQKISPGKGELFKSWNSRTLVENSDFCLHVSWISRCSLSHKYENQIYDMVWPDMYRSETYIWWNVNINIHHIPLYLSCWSVSPRLASSGCSHLVLTWATLTSCRICKKKKHHWDKQTPCFYTKTERSSCRTFAEWTRRSK